MLMDNFWDLAVPVLRRVWPIVFLVGVFALVMIVIALPVFISIPLLLAMLGLSPHVIVPVYVRLKRDAARDAALPATSPDPTPRWMRSDRLPVPGTEVASTRSPTVAGPSMEIGTAGTARPAPNTMVSPNLSSGTVAEPIAPSMRVSGGPLTGRSQEEPGKPLLLPHSEGISARIPDQPAPQSPPSDSPPRTTADLAVLPASAFREHCRTVLGRRGYRDLSDEPRATGPEGITPDLIGRDSLGRRAVVLCRQDAPGTVLGRDVVQAFLERRDVTNRLDRAAIVTTGRVDPVATRLARQHDLVLIDGDDLTASLSPADHSPDETSASWIRSPATRSK